MRRTRFILLVTSFSMALLTVAPAAMAGVRDHGGQGFYGETTDPVITNTMFLVIAFFPTVIILFAFIQSRLDKRRHAREDAARAREASVDWRGGW